MPGRRFTPNETEQLDVVHLQFGDAAASLYVGPLVLTALIEDPTNCRLVGDNSFGRLYIGTAEPVQTVEDHFEIPGGVLVAKLEDREVTVGRSLLTDAVEQRGDAVSADERTVLMNGIKKVSRSHARLHFPYFGLRPSDSIGVEDLGSLNGTFAIR